MRETQISIVVQGRFHAFALAKAMIEKGSSVQLLTNYPAFIVKRFGVPSTHVTGCAPLGLLHRYAGRWNLINRVPMIDKILHQGFSLWAARQISKTEPVAVHVFSGVALELFYKLRSFSNPTVRLLTRGSEHIVDQFLDLEAEERRSCGITVDKPSAWMVRRELQEYALADQIVTLSTFARKSFLKRGFSADKIDLLPLATNVQQFRPGREVIDARLQRIRSKEPLTVLCTGIVCRRKGIVDLIEVAKQLQGRVKIRWVGNVIDDAKDLVEASRHLIDYVPRQPERELPRFYNEVDGYVFGTIEDGYAVVLAQAKAACLPIIATEHSAAPDLLEEGKTGWTLPIRRPDLMVEKLVAWDNDRESMVQMVENLWQHTDMRDWADVADDFLAIVKRSVQLRHTKGLWNE